MNTLKNVNHPIKSGGFIPTAIVGTMAIIFNITVFIVYLFKAIAIIAAVGGTGYSYLTIYKPKIKPIFAGQDVPGVLFNITTATAEYGSSTALSVLKLLLKWFIDLIPKLMKLIVAEIKDLFSI
jgi:hypothetical protein